MRRTKIRYAVPLVGKKIRLISQWIDSMLYPSKLMAMQRTFGFTLIELMVTLAVAAILLTVAIPSFRSTVQNNRATGQANDLLSSLNVARSEAVKRGATVSVCISSDQAKCTGASWALGWLIWSDINGDGIVDAAEIIKVHEALTGASTLTAADNGGTAISSISYLSTGMTTLATGTTVIFQLRTPGCTGKGTMAQNRDITINAVGRASVTRIDCP
jgi:type IV fimbrial biogenesis protein FimT